MAEPKEINYLNFSDGSAFWSDINNSKFPFRIYMSLSQKVTRQRRVVYDIFMMFGDVGGLNDFLVLILSGLFGFISNTFLEASLVKELFMSEKHQGRRN